MDALIYLCAAGLGPDKLNVMFIDPDRSNGNLNRTRETLHRYRQIHQLVKGHSELFRSYWTCQISRCGHFSKKAPVLQV